MLAELLGSIRVLADEARGVSILAQNTHPRIAFVRVGAELRELAIPPPLRSPALRGLEDMVAAVQDQAVAPEPELYFDEKQVVVFLDRKDRRERATLALLASERFTTLRSLSEPRILSHKEAVLLLRHGLRGAVPEALVSDLRTIDFSRRSDGTATVAHGRESLGRSVELACQRAEKIPDSFTARVAPWQTEGLQGFEVELEVGLYLDLEEQRIRLQLLPDELPRAMRRAIVELRERLAAALPGVPLFHGAP